ncbi:4-azaleucine resistance transporter AzlC [Silvimonas terrae]|uniref:4-azaleucine resistance transporter AzlC n=1 Tax=Silvimonas terrae TaxID=300266 RepID=A0A840RLG6_9NEIS|nr:AzlC family ABC transporter permease [Silvimonas terrae]MBB5192961.1 4-azaleucine resistance transporter AzlC [Silvimonas terrae]
MDNTVSDSANPGTVPAAGFWQGARDTLPMLVGAAPFGVIFGTLASTAGLQPWATMLMSILVYGGSSQFVGVTLLAAGASIPVIVATTLIVNLRHALYSATLMPHVQRIAKPMRAFMAWFLTDETFAIVYHKIDSGEPVRVASYYMGSASAMYGNWLFWTAVGIAIGHSVPGIAGWGLEFAMVATFVGIVVPLLKSRSQVAAALSAGAVAMLANGLPYKLGLMAAAFTGIAVGMAVASVEGKRA